MSGLAHAGRGAAPLPLEVTLAARAVGRQAGGDARDTLVESQYGWGSSSSSSPSSSASNSLRGEKNGGRFAASKSKSGTRSNNSSTERPAAPSSKKRSFADTEDSAADDDFDRTCKAPSPSKKKKRLTSTDNNNPNTVPSAGHKDKDKDKDQRQRPSSRTTADTTASSSSFATGQSSRRREYESSTVSRVGVVRGGSSSDRYRPTESSSSNRSSGSEDRYRSRQDDLIRHSDRRSGWEGSTSDHQLDRELEDGSASAASLQSTALRQARMMMNHISMRKFVELVSHYSLYHLALYCML